MPAKAASLGRHVANDPRCDLNDRHLYRADRQKRGDLGEYDFCWSDGRGQQVFMVSRAISQVSTIKVIITMAIFMMISGRPGRMLNWLSLSGVQRRWTMIFGAAVGARQVSA
ncbi:MAG: hypothetical protein Q4G22_12485 [Paracoccus sp. (in: a-proteobacteria)]|uniref:hypothetical protein n=1 Tax=Paracoccus sp. TaxID=267 RepID=UPI0026DFBAFB|nr:hypothetical protein [Paracoccus sp. (in: a-proteobacteria)]MDO5632639.1 hypothetical protein [Paracoccus sp. (in: a-proteobacteria)]